MTMRPDWDTYFMDIATAVASRSTCDRAGVGAVFVRDKRILTTGFNGSPSGQEHCDDVGHLLVGGHCVRTIHAELNAIIQAALHGITLRDSTCYVTHFPCLGCAKALANVGLARLVYRDDYRLDAHAAGVLEKAGVLMERWLPAAGRDGRGASRAASSPGEEGAPGADGEAYGS